MLVRKCYRHDPGELIQPSFGNVIGQDVRDCHTAIHEDILMLPPRQPPYADLWPDSSEMPFEIDRDYFVKILFTDLQNLS